MTTTPPIPVEPGDMRRLVAGIDRRIARGELTASAAVAELADAGATDWAAVEAARQDPAA